MREQYTQKEIITPLIAEEWLKRQPKNRNINEIKIARFVKMMANNQWDENTGESIKFDVDGNLINGQHRLIAIIKTGITLNLSVAYNCSKEAIYLIDQGGRTINNGFQIKGVKYYSLAVPLIKAILIYKKTNRLYSALQLAKDNNGDARKSCLKNQSFNITDIDIYNYYDSNINYIERIINDYAVISKWKVKLVKFLPQSYFVKLAAILELEGARYNNIYEFLGFLVQQEEGGVRAIKQVRNIIMGSSRNKTSKLTSHTITEYIIRAWNKHITNDDSEIRLGNFIPNIIPK